MKASELRIGNLILLGDKVIIVSLDVLNRIGKRYYDTYPIPLTEEWLIKFGFEWCSNRDAYYISVNGFEIKFTIECNISPECYLDNVGIEIHHVHQLQNLYFALTQKELEIK